MIKVVANNTAGMVQRDQIQEKNRPFRGGFTQSHFDLRSSRLKRGSTIGRANPRRIVTPFDGLFYILVVNPRS